MKNKNYKVFFMKYLIPSLIIEIAMIFHSYYTIGYLANFSINHVFLYLFILFGMTMFWSFLNYFQETVGEVMEKGIIGIIIFLIIALIVIYLYKSTGKI